MDSETISPTTDEPCPVCGRPAEPTPTAAEHKPVAASPALRPAFYAMTLIGLVFAAAGGYICMRTIPRYAAIVTPADPRVPAHSAWILAHGWCQAIPGALLTVVGLVGVLSQRAGAGTLVLASVLLLAAGAWMAVTHVALLIPELTLV